MTMMMNQMMLTSADPAGNGVMQDWISGHWHWNRLNYPVAPLSALHALFLLFLLSPSSFLWQGAKRYIFSSALSPKAPSCIYFRPFFLHLRRQSLIIFERLRAKALKRINYLRALWRTYWPSFRLAAFAVRRYWHHRFGSLRSPAVIIHHRFGSPRSPITFTHRSPIQNINQRFGSFSFWFAFGCGWALYVLFAPAVSHRAFRLFFEHFSALRKVLEKFEEVIDSDTLWPFSVNIHHHLRKRILVFVAEWVRHIYMVPDNDVPYSG